MRRATITRIVLGLALGAATSAAVAWGCAIGGVTLRDHEIMCSANRAWDVDVQDRQGLAHVLVAHAGYFRPHNPVHMVWRSSPVAFDESLAPAWVTDGIDTAGIGVTEFVLAGWPRPCAWSVHDQLCVGNQVCRDRGALRYRRWADGYPSSGTLPIFPLSRGLALDTAFFGSLWWLGLFGLGPVRRTVRRRRGRCARCNYDLAGLPTAAPCPECGSERA